MNKRELFFSQKASVDAQTLAPIVKGVYLIKEIKVTVSNCRSYLLAEASFEWKQGVNYLYDGTFRDSDVFMLTSLFFREPTVNGVKTSLFFGIPVEQSDFMIEGCTDMEISSKSERIKLMSGSEIEIRSFTRKGGGFSFDWVLLKNPVSSPADVSCVKQESSLISQLEQGLKPGKETIVEFMELSDMFLQGKLDPASKEYRYMKQVMEAEQLLDQQQSDYIDMDNPDSF